MYENISVVATRGKIKATARFSYPLFVCTCSDFFIYASVADYLHASTVSVTCRYNEVVSANEYFNDSVAVGEALAKVLAAAKIKTVTLTGNRTKLKDTEKALINAVKSAGVRVV